MLVDNSNRLSGSPTLPPRCVALTFDDGPGPRTAELSEFLYAESIPATFFVLGENIERYRSVLDVHRACGHVIGLHGDVHHAFTSIESARDQIEKCRAKVAGYLGETVWFRPPYGTWDDAWDGALEGYAGPVGWDAHGRDWEVTYRGSQTVPGCVESLASRLALSSGGIALLHDFAPPTEFQAGNLTEDDLDLQVVEITRLLVERLRDEGFSFVYLSGAAA